MQPYQTEHVAIMRKKLRHLHYRLGVTRRKHVRRIRAASRHPFAVPIFVFVALAIFAIASYLLYARLGHTLEPAGNDIVIISHDHQTQVVPSHEPTVGALLAKLGIPINAGDVVEPAPDTEIHQDDF